MRPSDGAMSVTPHLALHRFGFGVRPEAPLPDDPLAWLDAQTRAAPAPLARPGYSVADGYAAWIAHDAAPPPPGQVSPVTRLFRAEQEAWAAHLLTSEAGFHDRLTAFWLNHFTVAERGGFGVTTGFSDFLRDVVRPRVTGRFADLLVAVSMAPAMLYYLDQVASVGPDSSFGRRSGRGLNENLAREILELHSLSPAGGYSQQDVTEFAKIITGWGVERLRAPFATVFRAGNHEPGEKRLLGEAWQQGPEAYEAALRRLAAHPATLRHIAFRMVRHFIADAPDPADVTHVAAVLGDSDGDLGAAARALVRLPAAWRPELPKLRPPAEYVVALFRVGGGTDPRPVLGGMAALGQPLWNAPQPNGWPDIAEGWSGPEPVMLRLDIAFETAGRFARQDPRVLLDRVLGPLAENRTRGAVLRAGSARDALALLFASPEMQRR
jgi:uncharacterized protein (DUF1800 family)